MGEVGDKADEETADGCDESDKTEEEIANESDESDEDIDEDEERAYQMYVWTLLQSFSSMLRGANITIKLPRQQETCSTSSSTRRVTQQDL